MVMVVQQLVAITKQRWYEASVWSRNFVIWCIRFAETYNTNILCGDSGETINTHSSSLIFTPNGHFWYCNKTNSDTVQMINTAFLYLNELFEASKKFDFGNIVRWNF